MGEREGENGRKRKWRKGRRDKKRME